MKKKKLLKKIITLSMLVTLLLSNSLSVYALQWTPVGNFADETLVLPIKSFATNISTIRPWNERKIYLAEITDEQMQEATKEAVALIEGVTNADLIVHTGEYTYELQNHKQYEEWKEQGLTSYTYDPYESMRQEQPDMDYPEPQTVEIDYSQDEFNGCQWGYPWIVDNVLYGTYGDWEYTNEGMVKNGKPYREHMEYEYVLTTPVKAGQVLTMDNFYDGGLGTCGEMFIMGIEGFSNDDYLRTYGGRMIEYLQYTSAVSNREDIYVYISEEDFFDLGTSEKWEMQDVYGNTMDSIEIKEGANVIKFTWNTPWGEPISFYENYIGVITEDMIVEESTEEEPTQEPTTEEPASEESIVEESAEEATEDETLPIQPKNRAHRSMSRVVIPAAIAAVITSTGIMLLLIYRKKKRFHGTFGLEVPEGVRVIGKRHLDVQDMWNIEEMTKKVTHASDVSTFINTITECKIVSIFPSDTKMYISVTTLDGKTSETYKGEANERVLLSKLLAYSELLKESDNTTITVTITDHKKIEVGYTLHLS